MSDTSTKYVLEFDQKGIPKAEAEQKKFGDTLDKTFTRATKQVVEFEKRFESLRKTMIKCSGDFAKAMEKGFDTRRVVKQLESLNKELARASRYSRGAGGGGGGGGGRGGGGVPFDTTMDSQFGPAIPGGGGGGGSYGGGGGGGRGGGGGGGGSPGRRSFFQGFLQGTLPPGYFIEKEGAAQQYAGVQAGRYLSGAVGSALTGGSLGAFAGGGVQGAIIDRAASYGEAAKQMQRQQLGGLPYLGADNMRKMRQGFDDTTTAATGLGMNASDVLGYRTQVAAASGLSQTDTSNQGLDYLGMAAGVRYGVSPQQVGAFAQAGAMGGTRDGGSGGDQMVNAINQGLSMALKGSDLQAFLGQIANDITQWKQSGIEVSTSSMGALGRELAQVGNMGNVRGAYSAKGTSDAFRQIGQQGASTPEQFELLQRMGANSGDPMSILHQQRLAARPENSAAMAKAARQELEDIVKRSSNDDVAFAAVTQAAPRLGINLGPGEVEGVIDSARGRGGGKRARILGQQRGAQRTTAAGIHNEAAGATPDILAGESRQTNTRIGIGDDTASAVQKMQDVADGMAKGAGKLVKNVEDAAGAVMDFGMKVRKTMQDMGMYNIGSDYARMMGAQVPPQSTEVKH